MVVQPEWQKFEPLSPFILVLIHRVWSGPRASGPSAGPGSEEHGPAAAAQAVPPRLSEGTAGLPLPVAVSLRGSHVRWIPATVTVRVMATPSRRRPGGAPTEPLAALARPGLARRPWRGAAAAGADSDSAVTRRQRPGPGSWRRRDWSPATWPRAGLGGPAGELRRRRRGPESESPPQTRRVAPRGRSVTRPGPILPNRDRRRGSESRNQDRESESALWSHWHRDCQCGDRDSRSGTTRRIRWPRELQVAIGGLRR
jgi:hypothetical protein